MDEKISLLDELTAPVGGDYLPILDVSDTSMAATGSTKKVKISSLPFLSLYTIVRTVDGSGNLIVSLKDINGNDFSPTNPGYFKIGDTVRTITGALSCSSLYGYNLFNLGSTELATQEVDMFPYLGWNTSLSAVFLTYSRIPCARVWNDFNYSDYTNEKYCENTTNSVGTTTTDQVECIGRFNAILSAGAGYTWSIPTTSIIINRPIYETRWLNWTPLLNLGSTIMSKYTTAVYMIKMNTLYFEYAVTGCTMSGSGSNAGSSLPFTGILGDSYYNYAVNNGSVWDVGFMSINAAGKELAWWKDKTGANWVANETNVQFHYRNFYDI